jgi:PAS domain S-box-containing protein
VNGTKSFAAGLPGTVWADKKPVVIENILSSNGTFFQVPMCRELGLQSALGVPVFMDGKVVAVLVFLMHNFGDGQKRRICLVSTAAYQLGAILERKMSEKIVRDAQENQEKKIRERTKDLLKMNESLKEQIEEHTRREESLIQSQENFATLVNSIDGIVWEYDLRTSKFSFVSEQAERTLGYPVSNWMTEPTFWQEHIHGGDRPGVLAFRERVVQEKKDDKFEYRMITADGRTIWLRDMVKAVVENDEVVKLRGVMVNITEPKQVEDALYQERNFVSAVFETAGALVMVLDTEGRIVRFNRACEQTSGISANDAKGRYFWDLFSDGEEVRKAKTIFMRLLAGQFPINDESYWPAKDGSRCSIAWSNTVILNKYGAVVHVIATGIDITKRKEAEHQLKKAVSDLARSNRELDRSSREVKEANQRLRELDEIKSHFISAASHELRTPLTSIKGYVESVLEDEVGPLNEQQKQFLGYVKIATDRLHRLLNELLDISKIESGQVRMSKSLTNLRNLLKEEVMIFKTQAQNKGIQMEIETEMSLREIYCDGDKIREVMDNLLSNAIKYTPQSGRIKIQAKNDERGVRIDVMDTGIGIAKDDLGRIFEPFQHIEKSGLEDEEESTGLGLTLVKRIVEAHDGTISVRSQQGNGSVFTVFLPAGDSLETKKNALVFTAS